MKTIQAVSFRLLGLTLLLASIAVMASGCIAVPVPGYEGGPGIALPVPAPPVVVAPVPVYRRGGYWGHGHWGHRRWGHYY
jgi:hypothetical protein